MQKAIDITFENITYSVEVEEKEEGFRLPCSKKYVAKQLLKNVSGIFKAGEVTAIMGASGAGKTTLLNVLACRVPMKLLEGKICANDTEYNF
jgi:ABC-type multidrug transport system ATPase subunit